MAHPPIAEVLAHAPWNTLEQHLTGLRGRVDESLDRSRRLRHAYRDELVENNPDLLNQIRGVSGEDLGRATDLLKSGIVAAADGTVAPVPLLGGSKIQVGVVIVYNSGEVVNLVTRVFEAELNTATTGAAFFSELRKARAISNLLSRAIMLFGERDLLLKQRADWRLIHGELIPHELRTGAGNPAANLPSTFGLIEGYINTEQFIAVSESSGDLDVMNAAILLEPGEYVVIRTLTDTLNLFLDGDPETGQQRANFTNNDLGRFRTWIAQHASKVAVVLVKAGPVPFLIECHASRVKEAVALFLADSRWTRGLESSPTVRGFPFLLDLADQVARTLFRGADFQRFVEARLMAQGVEEGLFELDPRRTRG
jgi:hypothetical protein